MLLLFINIYFIYLCGSRLYINDLIYLDVILIFISGCWLIRNYLNYRQVYRMMKMNDFITTDKLDRYLSNQVLEIIEQNNNYYQRNINNLNIQMQELVDYISRWSHEAKLPIVTMRLMNERTNDLILKKEMRLTIERLQLLLNTMLMSSKLRNPENDIKIEKILLSQVIKEAIKHHSYFLINDHFTIVINVKNEYVYSDRRWLTYMLDQFITNSIKYSQDNPSLIFTVVQNDRGLYLMVEDNGIGITKEDAPYIFDRGFTGHNLRDGDYRSTGMGLYFVKEIALKLGIEVTLDEAYTQGCRFKLCFVDNADYFLVDY